MTDFLREKLEAGVAALGLNIASATQQKLIDYIQLIAHWNHAFNLTAIRDPAAMVSKHLLDSLSVMPYVGTGRVADVGSGAGLPGIPLALVLPQTQFYLIDSNGKKTRFLTQAKIALGLDNIEVVQQRVEDYRPTKHGRAIYFDTVIARAYASTADILKSTAHLYHRDTRVLVMQGKLDTDITVPGYVLNQVHILNIAPLDAERHLLEIIAKH